MSPTNMSLVPEEMCVLSKNIKVLERTQSMKHLFQVSRRYVFVLQLSIVKVFSEIVKMDVSEPWMKHRPISSQRRQKNNQHI